MKCNVGMDVMDCMDEYFHVHNVHNVHQVLAALLSSIKLPLPYPLFMFLKIFSVASARFSV
jgi:hypothetical protein